MDVLLVSGPVKVVKSTGGQAVVVSARYEVHIPLAHCCASSHLIPAAAAGVVRRTPAAFRAASAMPCRNAPSYVGSLLPNRPASGPEVRLVASSRATRLWTGPVPPKARGFCPALTAARTK